MLGTGQRQRRGSEGLKGRIRSHNDGHLEAVPEGVMCVLLLHRYTTVPYNWNITEEEVAKVHSS